MRSVIRNLRGARLPNQRCFSTTQSSQPPIFNETLSKVGSCSKEHHFDLVVIGSGPSGQKCAIAAAKLGKRVAIIDKKNMIGGVCIHTGTVPSKTFREAILYLTNYRQRGFYGKAACPLRRSEIRGQDILDRVKKVEGWETETILDQLNRNNVSIIQGAAEFLDPYHVQIVPDSEQSDNGLPPPPSVVRGEKVLISCGTRPVSNPTYPSPYTTPYVYDSDSILKTDSWESAKNFLVVGSGVIAMEYASMFNSLPGCRVTIVDERLNPLEFVDQEVREHLKTLMIRQGATFRLGEKVVKVEVTMPDGSIWSSDAGAGLSSPSAQSYTGGRVRLQLASDKVIQGDALFYAIGRQGNTDTLKLENASLQANKRGLLAVNEFFQTSQPHIYATGDVIGFPALASTAMEQGRLAAQHMFDSNFPPSSFRASFPYGIYTIPEISVVGANEQELTAKKIAYEVGVAKFEETAKGQMVGGRNMEGFLKILFCPKSRKLFGCHCIGESAVEIIHIAQAVLNLGGTIDYFRDAVFNYPTMAEIYRNAALNGLAKLNGH